VIHIIEIKIKKINMQQKRKREERQIKWMTDKWRSGN
jgi:hypothetical protein